MISLHDILEYVQTSECPFSRSVISPGGGASSRLRRSAGEPPVLGIGRDLASRSTYLERIRAGPPPRGRPRGTRPSPLERPPHGTPPSAHAQGPGTPTPPPPGWNAPRARVAASVPRGRPRRPGPVPGGGTRPGPFQVGGTTAELDQTYPLRPPEPRTAPDRSTHHPMTTRTRRLNLNLPLSDGQFKKDTCAVPLKTCVTDLKVVAAYS